MNDPIDTPDAMEDTHDPVVPPPPGTTLPAAAQGLVLFIFGVALCVLLFGLPALFGRFNAHAAAGPDDNAAFHPTGQQWAGLKVQRAAQPELAPQLLTDGRIALDDDTSTSVFSPFSGRVTRVIARAGDVVAAGAPLFSVQSTELAQAENDMVSALATLHTAHAQLDLAATNESRQHQLFAGHGAALKDWQQSRVDLATAQGALNSAEIAVAAVRNRLAILGVTPRDIHHIETNPDPENVSADTVVRAPIAGTITARQVSPGQNIVGATASSGAANAVFVIGDLSKLWMVAMAPETDAGRIHVDDIARVTVPAYPGRVFDARVTYVAPVLDPVTHRLVVRAEIENPDGALKPDMLAQFRIITGHAAPALTVPDTAVVYEGSDAHVWVADPAAHTLALRNVTLGLSVGGQVEVLSGLKPTESVVTSGAVFIDRALSPNG
jgi:cobalt-zinc-cadmium efflux system membrane fusion protein